MSDRSTIEWTDATWNPVRGCTKVSPGCKHCYAETFAERWRGVPGHPFEHGFDLQLVPHKLLDPLSWKRPRKIFVNSMSDLFHNDVPDAFIEAVFETMRQASWHSFQLLTKRAERMRQVVQALPQALRGLPNVWLGVSVEDRKYGVPRIAELRSCPARVRFLSVEPLLEDLGQVDLRGIGWVIVGGESGPGARPMSPAWVRRMRDQCEAARVPFHFKQWGGVRKKLAGRELDGRTHDGFPTGHAAELPDQEELLVRKSAVLRLIQLHC